MQQWAIQTKTFIDGEFDSIFMGRVFNDIEDAQEELDLLIGENGAYSPSRFPSGEPGARLVTRDLPDWEPVVDG